MKKNIVEIDDAISFLKREGIDVVKSTNPSFSWFVPYPSSELPKEIQEVGDSKQEHGTHLTCEQLIKFSEEMKTGAGTTMGKGGSVLKDWARDLKKIRGKIKQIILQDGTVIDGKDVMKQGGSIEQEFIDEVMRFRGQIKEVILKDGTVIEGKKLMAEGGITHTQLEEGIEIEKEHKNLYDELKRRLNVEGVEMPMSEREFYTWVVEAHIEENEDYYPLLKKYVEKMKDGGEIKDQYKGKTAQQIWKAWMPIQRYHFLNDHSDVIDNFSIAMVNKYMNVSDWNKLPSGILLAVSQHVSSGQYGDGGIMKQDGIPNNYKWKTAEEVWNSWTEDQRTHFLSDHNQYMYPNKEYNELIPEIKKSIERHIHEGQYGNGGKIQKDFDAIRDLILDRIVENSSEVVGETPFVEMEAIAHKEASKQNFDKFCALAETISNKWIKEPIIEMCQAIKSGKFKSMFRFTYGGKARDVRRVSQVSSLFDLFIQAYNYEQYRDGGTIHLGADGSMPYIWRESADSPLILDPKQGYYIDYLRNAGLDVRIIDDFTITVDGNRLRKINFLDCRYYID